MTNSSDEFENLMVCGVPCTIYGTGDNRICVRHSDGAPIPLNQSEAHLLSRMSAAKTVGDWLETQCRDTVRERLKEGKHPILGRLLEWTSSFTGDADGRGARKQYRHLPIYKKYSTEIASLLERGLLAPVDKSLQISKDAGKPSAENCRITTLCIPTCGRSEYLSRCVSSFFHNLRSHGREDATILVVDDSADRVSEARNREAVTSLQASGIARVQFVGHEERQSLINALLGKNVAPPEVIQFALDAEKLLTTEGCVRNTIMLLTAGQYILQTDDDTACCYVSGNAHDDRLIISGAADPYQTHIFPDRHSNVASFPPSNNVDSFGIHERMLGKRLPDVLFDRFSIVWDQINPNVLLSSEIRDNRIDLTATGMSGDPGTSSMFGLLAYAPVDTLRRIYSNTDSYSTANTIREVLRLVPELTISRRSIFQAMSFGINNARLQPPFFSLGRNLDGAFALLYNLSDQGALIAHMPFAITHESEPTRRYDGPPAARVCGLQLTDILQLCLGSISCANQSNLSQALRCIGEQLVSIGSVSEAHFRSMLRGLYLQSRFALLSYLETLISQRYFTEERWIDDISRVAKDVMNSLLSERSIIPGNLVPACGPDGALTKAQWCIWMYGRLMLRWEEIYDVAREL